MKIIRYIIVVLMLIIAPLTGIQVFAHPPQNMVLDFNIDTMILNVTITHQVSNPNDHYIYKVEVKKNDVLTLTENYDSQPSTLTFTFSYSIDVQGGDVLKATAYCSIAGSIAREITIPHDGENNPPNKPEINGPSSGKAGTEYEYGFTSNDPESDDVYYCIQWGDDSGEICLGPFPSGIEQNAQHTWIGEGSYTVKIKARDINDAESNWVILEVSMPKYKSINPIFPKLFEYYTNIITIIKNLMRV